MNNIYVHEILLKTQLELKSYDVFTYSFKIAFLNKELKTVLSY